MSEPANPPADTRSLPVLLQRWETAVADATQLTDGQRELIEDTITGLTSAIEQYHEVLEERNAANADAQVLTAQVTTLRAELAHERVISAALAAARPAAAGERHHHEKIPDPERFSGRDRTKLRPYLAQLRLKAATFTDEQAKLRLAVNTLSEEALDQVLPYVQDDRVNFPTLAALITVLENAFGDPNRVANAEHRLNTIAQGTREFAAYYAEFVRYAAEVQWNEAAKLAALKRGLSYKLKQDMITLPEEPTTIDTLVAACNRLDGRRRALQSHPDHRQPAPAPPRPQRSPATAPAPAAPATPSTATGTQSGPMDLSSGRRRLSPEERAKRMAEGRCYYCGGVGHMARECTTKRQPLRAAEVTMPPAPEHTAGEEHLN
jgi:hypothetical protein